MREDTKARLTAAKKLITGGASVQAACEKSGISVATYYGSKRRASTQPKRTPRPAVATKAVRASRKTAVVTRRRENGVLVIAGTPESIMRALSGNQSRL